MTQAPPMHENFDKAKEALINTAFMDTASPTDGAIFFSGPKAKRLVKQLVKSSDGAMVSVLDTPALQEFNQYQHLYFGKNAVMSIEEGYEVGRWISEKFASEASGNVTIVIDGKVKPHGTFNVAEFSVLLKNPNVTGFTVIDYDTIKGQHNAQPERIPMNKEDCKAYVEKKLAGVADRRQGQRITADNRGIGLHPA